MAKIHRNSLKPGFKLQWYEIRRILGQGGFGITYLAHDLNLERDVAIKEYLPIELAVRENDFSVHPVTGDRNEQYKWGLDRFIVEARTLAKFKHPNVVQVLSVFEENNTGYMVMPYEQGQSLQQILSTEKTLEESVLIKIVIPVLGGLEQVHAAHFIHRDIKPDNIFIRHDGSPVLLDFGSARQALGVQTKTLTSLVSPGYAPFEQYYSKSDEQGPWTDIYGFGATLYRAIAGVAPMDAVDRSRAIHEAGRDVLVPAVEVGEGRYSERFLRAIDHALQFNKQDRPQSIADWQKEFGVAEDLAAITRRKKLEQQTTRPGTRVAGPRVKLRFRPATAVLLLVFMISLLALFNRLAIREAMLPYLPVPEAERRYEAHNQQIEQALAQLAIRTQAHKTQMQKELAITKLLQTAEGHFNAGRFIAPANGNALATYLAILESDPAHVAALAGKQRIFQHYLSTADQLIKEKKFEEAEIALQRADVIETGSATVKLARVNLNDARMAAERLRKVEEQKQVAALEQRKQAELARKAKAEVEAARLRQEEENRRMEAARVAALEAERKQKEKERQDKYQLHLGQAESFMNGEQHDRALQEYQLAMALSPGDSLAQEGINKAQKYLGACDEIIGNWYIKPHGITWYIQKNNAIHGKWLIFSADGNWECLSAREREFVIRWPGCAVCVTEYFYLSDDGNALNASRNSPSSGQRIDDTR